MDPIICGVRVVYFGGTTRIASVSNIVTESLTSFIRYTPRSSTQKKRVVQQRHHLYQTHGKITALRLVGDAYRCTYYVIPGTSLLLVVVHGINVKKQTGILERKSDTCTLPGKEDN